MSGSTIVGEAAGMARVGKARLGSLRWSKLSEGMWSLSRSGRLKPVSERGEAGAKEAVVMVVVVGLLLVLVEVDCEVVLRGSEVAVRAVEVWEGECRGCAGCVSGGAAAGVEGVDAARFAGGGGELAGCVTGEALGLVGLWANARAKDTAWWWSNGCRNGSCWWCANGWWCFALVADMARRSGGGEDAGDARGAGDEGWWRAAWWW